MASNENRYQDDLEVDSLHGDENKFPSRAPKLSISIFSVPFSLLVLCLALLICNVMLYTQNQQLKLAANDSGFSKSSYSIPFYKERSLTALKAGIYAQGMR